MLTIRESFFDSAKVQKQMDAATRRGFQTIGRETRKAARASLKVSNKPSEPGQPPHIRKGSPLRALMLYSYESTTKSVVIGPAALGAANTPPVLEFGGTVKPKRNRRGRPRRPSKIKPRPYMGPALELTQTKIPDVFDGILTKRR